MPPPAEPAAIFVDSRAGSGSFRTVGLKTRWHWRRHQPHKHYGNQLYADEQHGSERIPHLGTSRDIDGRVQCLEFVCRRDRVIEPALSLPRIFVCLDTAAGHLYCLLHCHFALTRTIHLSPGRGRWAWLPILRGVVAVDRIRALGHQQHGLPEVLGSVGCYHRGNLASRHLAVPLPETHNDLGFDATGERLSTAF